MLFGTFENKSFVFFLVVGFIIYVHAVGWLMLVLSGLRFCYSILNVGSSGVHSQVQNKAVHKSHTDCSERVFGCLFLLSCFYIDQIDHAVCQPQPLEPVYPVVMAMQLVIRSQACDLVPSIVLRPLKSP